MRNGIIYCTIGDKWTAEATSSARSALKICSGVGITLFTNPLPSTCIRGFEDIQMWGPLSDKSTRLYDAKLSAIRAMMNTPYERTIYLDSDTYVCTDLTPLYEALDTYHILITFSARRGTPHFATPSVPGWFPEYSSGMIAYRKCLLVDTLLEGWAKLYIEYGSTSDQISLRSALWSMTGSLNVGVLPSEYNCYVLHPVSVGGPVHVLHGRGVNLRAIHKRLSESNGIRAYIPGHGIAQVVKKRAVIT